MLVGSHESSYLLVEFSIKDMLVVVEEINFIKIIFFVKSIVKSYLVSLSIGVCVPRLKKKIIKKMSSC